jgi:hypothetical protein
MMKKQLWFPGKNILATSSGSQQPLLLLLLLCCCRPKPFTADSTPRHTPEIQQSLFTRTTTNNVKLLEIHGAIYLQMVAEIS